MKTFLSLLLFPVLLPFCSKCQTIDWYELVIIPELQNANFLVVQVDSVGKKCEVKRELRYCTEPEEAHDFKVIDLQKKQFQALNGISLHWKLVNENSLEEGENADKEKYRYLIDYDFDLIGIDKGRNSVIYLKLDFILIDRVTGNILGRSMQYDLNDPFEPMELLIDELIEMNTSE